MISNLIFEPIPGTRRFITPRAASSCEDDVTAAGWKSTPPANADTVQKISKTNPTSPYLTLPLIIMISFYSYNTTPASTTDASHYPAPLPMGLSNIHGGLLKDTAYHSPSSLPNIQSDNFWDLQRTFNSRKEDPDNILDGTHYQPHRSFHLLCHFRFKAFGQFVEFIQETLSVLIVTPL
jgi:hypothetical protein